MQPEALVQLKQRIVLLDNDSKKDLADFLADELDSSSESGFYTVSDEDRKLQTEWFKQNREKYAGRYVALSGNELVGEGRTIHEAHKMAKENGVSKPFLTFVFSKHDVPFGGW
ncbi:MAG: DUF5678 domain-containing protein [Pyrinomonadaceae bacterium]